MRSCLADCLGGRGEWSVPLAKHRSLWVASLSTGFPVFHVVLKGCGSGQIPSWRVSLGAQEASKA